MIALLALGGLAWAEPEAEPVAEPEVGEDAPEGDPGPLLVREPPDGRMVVLLDTQDLGIGALTVLGGLASLLGGLGAVRRRVPMPARDEAAIEATGEAEARLAGRLLALEERLSDLRRLVGQGNGDSLVLHPELLETINGLIREQARTNDLVGAAMERLPDLLDEA